MKHFIFEMIIYIVMIICCKLFGWATPFGLVVVFSIGYIMGAMKMYDGFDKNK